MPPIRLLSREDVIRALPMREAIEAMKSAYAQLSSGRAEMPLRGRVAAADGGTLLVMPAFLQASNALGVKLVSVAPNNPQRGLPMIHAMVLAFNPQTGEPLAILEGGALTAIRTGAGAGAATDILARKDARTAAIIGSGVQARTQLEAVCTVRHIERVTVYSRTRANAEAFAQSTAGRGAIPSHIEVCDTPEQAVRDADIICTATTSFTPVFDGQHIKDGAHINGVGSYLPTMQELDVTTVQRALITVDSREAVMAEAGELIIALNSGAIRMEHIHAEIGEVINGTKAGRTDESQITFFKSVGVAVQDAAAASVALHRAMRENIGQVIPF